MAFGHRRLWSVGDLRAPWPLGLRPPKGSGPQVRRRLPSPYLSNSRQNDSLLSLVFAFLILIGNFANFVGLEKNDLAESFI